MTNKEYKAAREEHEQAYELDTFTTYSIWGHENRYMKPDDLKEMGQEYKEIKATKKAFALDDFGGRALVIPTESGYILKSYYTDVCEIRENKFIKLWQGYSNTTLKHINAFRSNYNFPTISKREWIEMEANKEYFSFEPNQVIAQKVFATLILDYTYAGMPELNFPPVVHCRVLIDGYFCSRFTTETIEQAIEKFNNTEWRLEK